MHALLIRSVIISLRTDANDSITRNWYGHDSSYTVYISKKQGLYWVFVEFNKIHTTNMTKVSINYNTMIIYPFITYSTFISLLSSDFAPFFHLVKGSRPEKTLRKTTIPEHFTCLYTNQMSSYWKSWKYLCSITSDDNERKYRDSIITWQPNI